MLTYIRTSKVVCFKLFLSLIFSTFLNYRSFSQGYESRSFVYNVLTGAVTGGIGSIINKHHNQKWYHAFAKGFVTGSAGGAIVYSGKKLNFLIASERSILYGRLSRVVFSAGNSIVENAAANRPFYSQWHYDVGFIRLQFNGPEHFFMPRLMPSNFAGMLFIAFHGELDLLTTLYSGTFTFRTPHINYAGHLVGSTTGNGFLLVDTIFSDKVFHDVYAHEMVHSFQFQEFSGINYFAKPVVDKWKEKYPRFKEVNRWIYWDLNYEAMLFNYFIINGGYRRNYCSNFLENEAEVLSTGKVSCPQ
jgi:hypothetical protein